MGEAGSRPDHRRSDPASSGPPYNLLDMARFTTRGSLLARLANDPDELAWQEFHRQYARMITRVAERRGLQPADCEDVVQDVPTADGAIARTKVRQLGQRSSGFLDMARNTTGRSCSGIIDKSGTPSMCPRMT